MRFERRIVGTQPAAEDEPSVLPDDLAQLGALLGQQAQQLAEIYPADQERPAGLPTDPISAPARRRRRPWRILARVAAVLMVAVSVTWLSWPGSHPDEKAQPAARTANPASSSGLGMNHVGTRRSAEQVTMPWSPLLRHVSHHENILNAEPNKLTPEPLESPFQKCGTGPESEGIHDLWEAQNPKRVTISM